MKLYALKFIKSDPKRHVNKDAVGQLVRWTSASNDGAEYAVSTRFELSYDASTDQTAEPVWVVFDRETAEKVAVTHTEWFNAGYSTPENPYVGLLEVVELEVSP